MQSLANFAWSIAELLRGDFKQSEYGKVVLPFVVMRRLDALLEPTKEAVVAAAAGLPEDIDEETRRMILLGAVGGGVKVYNTSRLTFAKIRQQDAEQLHANLVDYISGFSPDVQDAFLEKFLITDQLKRL
ncbi:MAG: type I restriction-modification system subunit M N-terminal domain-containing protein [Oceanicaulis sp.]|nr:type I restriction-modification system subunit M N-terminal domain-containing protein [Oceanicaulis sp.]